MISEAHGEDMMGLGQDEGSIWKFVENGTLTVQHLKGT